MPPAEIRTRHSTVARARSTKDAIDTRPKRIHLTLRGDIRGALTIKVSQETASELFKVLSEEGPVCLARLPVQLASVRGKWRRGRMMSITNLSKFNEHGIVINGGGITEAAFNHLSTRLIPIETTKAPPWANCQSTHTGGVTRGHENKVENTTADVCGDTISVREESIEKAQVQVLDQARQPDPMTTILTQRGLPILMTSIPIAGKDQRKLRTLAMFVRSFDRVANCPEVPTSMSADRGAVIKSTYHHTPKLGNTSNFKNKESGKRSSSSELARERAGSAVSGCREKIEMPSARAERDSWC
jgi:hypothetical protein